MSDTMTSSFCFQLTFSGQQSGTFLEVSGLVGEMLPWNSDSTTVPSGVMYPNLVLKRGLIARDSLFCTWCANILGGSLTDPIRPQPITLTLMDTNGKAIVNWDIHDAWPVKWLLTTLDIDEIPVETLEIAFRYLERR